MAVPSNRARRSLPADEPARTSTIRRRIYKVHGDVVRARDDLLAVEEPLEIRLYPSADRYVPVAVTMRTPGHDFDLAAGFLYTEGVLRDHRQIRRINYCADGGLDSSQRYNIVNVFLQPDVAVDEERLHRNFYASSSCGVCGKASIDAVRVRGVAPIAGDGVVVDDEIFPRLVERLRQAQTIFDKTGGLHAAGLFDPNGSFLAIREDVGRHNAVDKLVGSAFLAGAVPLSRRVLVVSGRTGFEIVQKAAVAGIPFIAGVSAPSSLACDLARAFGMTLVGFIRDDRYGVYAGPQRIRRLGTALLAVE